MKRHVIKLASAAALAGLTLMGVAQPAMATTVDMGYVAKNPAMGPNYYDVKKELVKLDTTGRVNYVPGYGILLWAKPGNEPTKRYLAHGSSWKVFGYVTDANGHKWYNLGGSQWVDSSYIVLNNNAHTEATTTSNATNNITGVVRVSYWPNSKVMVWSNPGVTGSNKYLTNGSRWKFFKIKYIGDNSWYNLGGNQWIEGKYAINESDPLASGVTGIIKANKLFTVTLKQGNKVYDSPYGYGKATGQVLPLGSRWKVTGKVINHGTWYRVGTNQWINIMY
ncbi:SLAP domain-containing protein [Lactobacillus psittaci]|uniref:LytA n=1 Tax=Lactobacillus psittaci DSM 15354 TaxID=1122152 RepID=A0A0R1S7P0_9LACO|nr:SLAP domain-containing protein [Lactobacillus psittaci]KRL62355.1 LytA [Lactobacillus psittaci DSM 15354]